MLTIVSGWGGIFAVMLMRRFGRLPILLWSQLFATGWMIGCTFAPNLNTFTGEKNRDTRTFNGLLNHGFDSDAVLERILRVSLPSSPLTYTPLRHRAYQDMSTSHCKSSTI